MAVGVRQQREETRAQYCLRQHALIACFGAGDAARHDLAGFGDVLAQRVEIFVIDLGGAFGGETAELFAAEKLGHGYLRNLSGCRPELFGGGGLGLRFARSTIFAGRTFATRFVVVGTETEAVFVTAAAAL